MNYPVMLGAVTPAPLRKDAARNWHRIVEAGRRCVDEGTPIQLNDVAKAASVGVATVYRHFPTPEALMEAVAAAGLEALAADAERALAEDDAWLALEHFLLAAAEAAITDASIPAVMARRDVLPATREIQRRLAEMFAELLGRAQAAGVVNPEVTAADIPPLMCAVAYAAQVRSPERADDRAADARHYLSILLQGVRKREP